jgi:hypothetical protein
MTLRRLSTSTGAMIGSSSIFTWGTAMANRRLAVASANQAHLRERLVTRASTPSATSGGQNSDCQASVALATAPQPVSNHVYRFEPALDGAHAFVSSACR